MEGRRLERHIVFIIKGMHPNVADEFSSPFLFKEGGVPERSLGRGFQIRFNALCPSLSKRDDTDAIKRSPSLFKEGGVPERSLGREFQIRSNALCPSLSKRDDADAIKRSPFLFKEGGVPERSLGREFK